MPRYSFEHHTPIALGAFSEVILGQGAVALTSGNTG